MRICLSLIEGTDGGEGRLPAPCPCPPNDTHDPEMARYAGRQVTLRDGMVATNTRSSPPRRQTLAADC